MTDLLNNLSKVLPALIVIVLLAGLIGWWLRGMGSKPAPAASAKATPERPNQDRSKNLESALDKAKAAHKTLKSELEDIKSASVAKAAHDEVLSALESAKQAAATEAKRSGSLEADLKKSLETLKTLNARSNEADKAQKDRNFAIQNELSKAREELALLQNRPDDTAALQTEIERLRESVATANRFAGELRKREAAAVEALEKARAQISREPAPSSQYTPAPPPVGDSDRVAAAKAEVLRLLELNKQNKPTAVLPPVTAIAPIIGVVEAALAETLPAAEEPIAAEPEIPSTPPEAPPVEPVIPISPPDVPVTEPAPLPEIPGAPLEIPAPTPEAPAVLPAAILHEEESSEKKAPPTGELFSLD